MVVKINLGAMLPGCFSPKKMMQKDDSSSCSAAAAAAAAAYGTQANQRISLSDISDPGSPLSVNDLSNSLIGSNLHIFTLADLKLITHDFSASNFLGEGGFGPVYKGFLDERIRPGLKPQPVAVKLLDLDGSQGHREWLTEVIYLGQLRHPHLVKLIGYCCEDEHRLLVYEYMARGNLENQLFKRYSIALPWLTRMKIALDAAKGLAFLHGEEKPVIYRDFKSSNVLLDSDYRAKLSDFGLAKDGPSGDDTHVTTRVMGTHGYAAPEYIMTGHLTAMSDVYSFGVVLLELLTGKRAVDKNRPAREHILVEWGRPLLRDHHKMDKIIDSKLDGQYSFHGAKKAAVLAYHCLSHQAKFRPSMAAVVKELEEILACKKDIPVGSFVYVVPTTNNNVKDCKREAVDGHENLKANEEEEKQKKKNRNGRRQKLRSRAVYSDTALYSNLRRTNMKSHQDKGSEGCVKS